MERVRAEDVFFCYMSFELNYGADFPNNPHKKQDPQSLRQRRF